MPEKDDQGRSARETQIVDESAETPSRTANVPYDARGDRSDASSAVGGMTDEDLADATRTEVRIDEPSDPNAGELPPPSAHRADTMVRAVGPDARTAMERDDTRTNEASFTKGINAPTADRTRYPYTVEQMDEYLTEAPRGLFPDTPGGDGATPLSADRNSFLAEMGDRGHFPSQDETEKWARAVFNALRQHAVETDDALATEFADVVRVGEAPEVQVEEMMWGGDPIERMSRLVATAGNWSQRELYEQVAEEVGETVDDPWVDAAVHSFMGTLKAFLGPESDQVPDLGELQPIWDRV